jgi:hypothetical protein
MITLPANIAAHINDDPYIAAHLIELQGASVEHPMTALTAALAGAGAGNVNGIVKYVVTYVTAAGETDALFISAPVTAIAASNGKVNLSAIAVSPSAAVTSRRIYRTFGGGSAYFLQQTIANNTAVTGVQDNTADGSLGAALPTFNVATSASHFWTDYTSDLVWSGNTYVHTAPFTVSQIVTDAEGVQAVSLQFDEQAQQLQAIDLNEGMQDRIIRIHEAWIDTTDKITIIDVDVDLVKGRTDGIDFDEESGSTGTLSVSPSFAPLTQQGPRNIYDLSCSNLFGDARCKATGIPCDNTYAGCTSKANTINYRGCRHALTPPATVKWGGSSTTLDNRPPPDPPQQKPPPVPPYVGPKRRASGK